MEKLLPSGTNNTMQQAQIDALNAIVTSLQDFITANPVVEAPAPTPAQLSIENETITLSDGSQQTFANGVWTPVTA